jgi:DNA-binding transcriptional LysR family regulator
MNIIHEWSAAPPALSIIRRREATVRIDVLGLQAFVSIAERGSFHGAASHLNLSQTALSHRIRKLEESLATQLFMRTTRQVTLTAAGTTLLPRAKKLFAELGEAIGELRGAAVEREDRVVFGCLPTIAMECLPKIISDFARAHPGVQVKVLDNSATEIAERVQAGDAEFGVTIVAANRWDLELKPVAKEPFVLVCHRDLPIAANRSLTWSQIQDVPLVRISAETGNRILIDDALGARRETLSWRYEVQRVTTAVSLVRSGIGGAIVPQLAFDVVDADDVIAIALKAPTVTRTLGIVTRKGAPLNAPTRQLLRMVTTALKAKFRKT